MLKQYMVRCSTLFAVTAAVLISNPSHAVDLNLSPTPLFLSPSVAPLNMLVVGRDHKLYYEAYNDASDLNGDGKIDAGYKGYLPNPTAANPTAGGIDYYGYFDSYKCYTYTDPLFSPTRTTATKQCGGSGEWSGDYLNYLTMSRIDALRKVLYGGQRDVDTATETILIRSHIPMDAHSWGKEYAATDTALFNIRNYTPYDAPTTGTRHLFANTTPNNSDLSWTDNTRRPRLRVLLNSPYRIWEWVSKESPVAGETVAPPSGTVSVTFSDEFRVRVKVCDSNLIGTENCKRYPNGNYKPVGLLHEFGENNSMLFGLLTGSYTANKSGGVLRKNMGSITDEINTSDGTLTNVNGIIRTLDKLRVAAYSRYTSNGGTSYDCGLPAMARGAPTDGTCRMWGNPVAEMMYETLRYFRGMSPTSAFTAVYGASNTTVETTLGLPRPSWTNPYTNRPVCAKPFETVMADINNSYDSDQLPGSSFTLETGSNAISDELPNLNVTTLAQQITDNEPGIAGLRFIGQSGATYDGAPTPKTVTSLANIRGLAPEEPTKQGSYYAASVAYHGLTNDMSTSATGDQKVQTFAVALASPLPKIEIPVGSTTVTLVPFAKSVKYNNEIVRDQGSFQPTNQIVDFYVESLADDRTSGTFQVNFEDVEAGNDHDMDAIARYSYSVVNGTVQVDVSSDYQAGGIIHHIGYVISGTTHDGVYLVVQDCNKTGTGTYNCNTDDPDYFLDTPTGQNPGGTWADNTVLPGFSSRTFTPSSTGAATLLKDPLWYAAKWGGFRDTDGNNRPNLRTEWDTDAPGTVGYDVPDNYFLVTNALTLSQQLRSAFAEIIARSTSASSASVNSGSISTDTRIYQARFDTRDWTGQLLSYGISPTTGELNTTPLWDASDSSKLPGPASRNIITVNSNNAAVAFEWANLDATRKAQLSNVDATGEVYVSYLRGDTTHEARNESATANPRYGLRNRPLSRLGDIVASAPMYVGVPRARYSDSLESRPYSTFVSSKRTRNAMVYVGANDGMLHGFDAGGLVDLDGNGPQAPVEDPNGGREVFAFIPKTVFGNLKDLTSSSYAHRYFVDGAPNSNDVFINDNWRTVLVGGLNFGGQGIYALDVTNPGSLGTSSFLWEINDRTADAQGNQLFLDLGYTYSQPAIVRLQDGTWAAVFGNGYNNTANDGAVSTTGNAVLYVVDIETGNLLRKFDTGIGFADDPTGAGRANGMATPTMVDVDGDRVVDHAYVGDLFGNLWKIDMRSTNPTGWGFAFGTAEAPEPFFIAKDGTAADANRQSITVRPEVARGPYGSGVMVLFGTGKYLEPTDKSIVDRRPQTFYGLVDTNTYTSADQISSRSSLQAQTIVSEFTIDPDNNSQTPNSYSGRTTSNQAMMAKGWYMDLLSPVAPPNDYKGERSVTDPLVRDDRVIFTTLIPSNDECGFGGKSWLMVLDLLSGSKLPEAQLDTNGNNRLDSGDQIVSGVSSDEILARPAGLLCLSNDCQADRLMSSGTSGEMDERALKSVGGARGRQSWRQIR